MPYAEKQEITTPELKKFDGVGDYVEGILKRREFREFTDDKTKRKRQVPVYFVEQADGCLVKFLAGVDLEEKLMQVPFRSHVHIVFEKTAEMKDGKAPMKVFKVLAMKFIPAEHESLEITDADIPF